MYAQSWDIIIVGTGMGGATLVHELAPLGYRILLLEKGDFLRDSNAAHSHQAIFSQRHFQNASPWLNDKGQSFVPGNYHYVGGNSKFFGAVMYRFREWDFQSFHYPEGESPAWPIDYDALEPYYQRAEALYQVHGELGPDDSEPMHSESYGFTPVPDEPSIAEIRARLKAKGYHPGSLPLGIDVQAWQRYSQNPWDAFPNASEQTDIRQGKKDAQTAALDAALSYDNVTLLTNADVTKLVANNQGRIDSLEVTRTVSGTPVQECYQANTVCLSAGAANSALLWQRSKLADPNQLVGRCFMNHNSSILMAFHPFKKNHAVYQKTLAVNDFASPQTSTGYPLGNIQLLGKVSGDILKANARWLPRWLANWIAARTVDWYVMSEDLPDRHNRIQWHKSGKPQLVWQRNNLNVHRALMREGKRMMRRAGYPIVVSQLFPKQTISHQCGTLVFGDHPSRSVLNTYCRSWDYENLFVVDASFFPSSGVLNPALTIAAQAIRVADFIQQTVPVSQATTTNAI